MLFRASSIVLLFSCLGFLLGIKPVNYTLAALLAVWTVVSIRGMVSMRSQVFGQVYWRGDTRLKAVALTFDDGPHEPYTAQVLDVLKAHGVSATFFVIGANLKANPELARRIHTEGHEFGNHTYSHPWMFRMLFKSIKQDIVLCQDEIERVSGVRPRFFRQPIGMNNPSVMKVIDEMGMVMVGWQTRAYDAVRVDKEDIVRRILGGVRPGGIVLLHDGCDGKALCDRTPTVEAIGEIIPALKAEGYEFVKVSELIGVENRQGQCASKS
jgi:peptidoglycan/xylan/chitin deacetylase (PgdA/CDA1 family)